jgi:hypothetical protein
MLAWDPDADSVVKTLAVSGTTVYAGGNFTKIGNQTRNGIAALKATTGNALAWNPDPGGTYHIVYSLAVSGPIIYAGGLFASIGGQTRSNIAALDATTGNALAWDPNADRTVGTLAVSGPIVYAGGYFAAIGGQPRNRIAALDATTGNALAWNPNADDVVYSVAAGKTTVYVGGWFKSIGQGFGHPDFAQFGTIDSTPIIRSIPPSAQANNAGVYIANPIGTHCRSGASVKMAYKLPSSAQIIVRLYTINGRLHSELVNTHQDAGQYTLNINGNPAATGSYLLVFKAGEYHREKMVFIMK